MKPLKKRVLTGSFGFILLVALLPAAAGYYLESGHARKWILREINRAIPGALSWQATHVSLPKGEIVLDGVGLQGPAGEPIAGWHRLRLDLAWKPLFQGRLQIEELDFEQPRLDLSVDPSGCLNLVCALVPPAPTESRPAKAPGTEFGLPIEVVIDTLRLRQGRFSFKDAARGLAVTLPRLDLTASADLGRRAGRLSLQAAGLDGSFPQGRIPLERIDLDLALDDGRIAPLNLTVENDAARILVSGSTEGVWERPVLDLTADVSTDLCRLADLLAVEEKLTGAASGRIRLRGAASDPEFEAVIDYGGGTLFAQAVDSAHLAVELKNHRLEVTSADIRAADGRATLSGRLELGGPLGDVLAAPDRLLAEAAWQALLKAANIPLERVLAGAGKWGGLADGTVAAEGRGLTPGTASLTVEAEFDAGDVAAEWLSGPTAIQVRASGGLDAGIITLGNLEATTGAITLSAAGRLNTVTQAVDARLSLNGRGVGDLLAAPELRSAKGRIRLDASAGGSLDAPRFQFDLKADGFRYDTVSLGDVSIAAGLDTTGVLQVTALEVHNGSSTARGRGTLRLFDGAQAAPSGTPPRLTVHLKQVRPTDFYAASPVHGSFSGTLSVSGSPSAPEAALTLSADEVTVTGNRVGDITAEAGFAAGTLHLERLAVVNGRSKLEASGTAALLQPGTFKPFDDPRFELAFKAPRIELGDFASGISGTLTAQGRVGGRLSRPTGAVECTGSTIDTGWQRLEQVTASAVMEGGRIEVRRLAVRLADRQSVTGTGWIDTGGRFGFDLSSDGISLATMADGRLAPILSGQLRFEINGDGTLEAPVLRGRLSTSGLRLNGKPIDDADLSLALADDRLQVKGRLNFDLDASLVVRQGDFRLQARFDGTDLRPYFRAAGQPDLDGTLSAELQATGNLEHLERADLVAAIGALKLDFRRKEVLRVAGARLSMSGAAVNVPNTRVLLPGGSHLDVAGSGRLDGDLDFSFTGSVPVEALGQLTGAVTDLRGQVDVSGTVGGPVSKPDIAATLTIADSAMTIVETGQALHDLRGLIRIEATGVDIQSLDGRVGDGRFHLSGKVALADYRPERGALTFTASAIPVTVPGTLDMHLSSRLDISGNLENVRVKGELVLLDGTYYRDVSLDLTQSLKHLTTKHRQVDIEDDSETQPFFERVHLNVAVRRKQPFVVDNNLASLEVDPDLVLRGSLANPILTGRATVEAGTVTYGKTVFDIQKGVIDFNNPYRIEPQFDIEAQTQVRDWLITLTIRGTPDALDLALASDPPLESGAIGSLLVFGKTPQELSGGQSTPSGQSASNMLAELLAASYAGDIKKATGLDVFEVHADADSGTQEEHVTVTVGKEISERMTVKVGTEKKNGEYIQRAIAEYKILQNLLVSGFQDTSGSFGGSIKYRLEFR